MKKILVFGDSIAYGKWDIHGGWVQRLREYIDKELNIGKNGNHQIYNLGIPGDNTRKLLQHIESEIKERIVPDDELTIILQVGVNDANHANSFAGEQIPLDEFESNYKQLIELAQKYTENIIILGIMPIDEEALWQNFPNFNENFYLKDVTAYFKKQVEIITNFTVANSNIKFIDLFNYSSNFKLVDGIHPGESGHKSIFHLVKKALDI